MGLGRFADFERGNFDGITYVNTIFLKPVQSNNENMYFHELVHVIQWRLLGPDRFLLSYANGLECFGYRQSLLLYWNIARFRPMTRHCSGRSGRAGGETY